jgi:hypothetical protein
MQDNETLMTRWEQAFDEIKNIPDYKSQVKSWKYASNSRYNLDKFTWDHFPADGPMSDEVDNHEYGFNDKGLPCYVKFSHPHKKDVWEGCYSYTTDLVEYVEFYTNSGVPSAITRLFFDNGRKTILQSLVINGRGSIFSHLKTDRSALIKKIKEHEGSYFAFTTRFEYNNDGKICSSKSMHITPGIGTHASHDEYYYDGDTLDTIRTFDDQGNNRLTYSRNRENLDADTITSRLAQQMAEVIVTKLSEEPLELPLAYLEVVYHYADSYLPLLCYLSENDVKEKQKNKEFIWTADLRDPIEIPLAPFEDLFVQMETLMQEEDNMDAGRNMLTKVATTLTTTQLLGKIQATADFAAIAIDPSIEGHSTEELIKILQECGVTDATISQWKQKNMF